LNSLAKEGMYVDKKELEKRTNKEKRKRRKNWMEDEHAGSAGKYVSTWKDRLARARPLGPQSAEFYVRP
jgi:hypothetical protein